MNFLQNDKIKKISTYCLIAVLVFINAVKIFHTHDFSSSLQTEKFAKGTTTVKPVFSCAICDFQLAKDSDVTISTIHCERPFHFISVHYYYILPVATSFAIASDNKGPPSFA